MNLSVQMLHTSVTRLTEDRYLGAKPIWNFLTGNNALPHTEGMRQPVHKDITFFHPQVLMSDQNQHHLLSVTLPVSILRNC